MSDRERVRREDPKREGPFRNPFTFFRGSESGDGGGASGGPGPRPGGGSGTGRDPISGGVELAYGVVEEQIKHGQRIASKLNDRSYDASEMSRDAQEAAQRFMAYSGRMASLWMEFMGRMASDPWGAWGGKSSSSDSSNPWWWGANVGVNVDVDVEVDVDVSVEVDSKRPTRIDLKLAREAIGKAWGLDPLVGNSETFGAQSTLSDVRFEPSCDDHPAKICVNVPLDMPADTYTTDVHDADSGKKLGKLAVTVLPS